MKGSGHNTNPEFSESGMDVIGIIFKDEYANRQVKACAREAGYNRLAAQVCAHAYISRTAVLRYETMFLSTIG